MVVMVIIARAGWIVSEDAIVLFYLIINCTALILGKLQRILDRFNEYEKSKKIYKIMLDKQDTIMYYLGVAKDSRCRKT